MPVGEETPTGILLGIVGQCLLNRASCSYIRTQNASPTAAS